MNKDYEKAIKAEVEHWPGVEVEFAQGGKHPKAKLKFNGKLLAAVFPATPGNTLHGIRQTLGTVRRTIKKLGAERSKPEPTKEEDEAPYRPKNDGKAKREMPISTGAGDTRSPVAEQLIEQGIPLQEKREKRSREEVAVKQVADGFTDDRKSEEQIRAEFEARVAGIVDGIYFGLPEDVYHAVPRLSSSGIKKMMTSPGTFWADSWMNPNRVVIEDDVEWKVIGHAYHIARLEPHLWDKNYIRGVDKSDAPKGTLFTGDDMKEALEEMGLKKTGKVIDLAERLADNGYPEEQLWPLILKNLEDDRQGRIVLKPETFDSIVEDMTAIRKHTQIAPLLSGGEAEVSVFWTDEHGVQLKARIDYLTRDWWTDFKSFANSNGKRLHNAICDAVRYNGYYVQATVYREAVEAIRMGGLQIIESQTDDQKTLIAALQIKPAELDCHFIFQEKKGIPNLLAYEFNFYMVPFSTIWNEQITDDEARRAAVREMTSKRTQIFMRGQHDVLRAKQEFVLYSQVYESDERWAPIDAIRQFTDDDFHPFWLAGTIL